MLDYFADPTDPGHVLAVAEPPALSGLMPRSCLESRDGGLDYGTILHPGVAAAASRASGSRASDPRTIYVALFETSAADALTHPRLARAADAGVTWETIDLEPMLGPAASPSPPSTRTTPSACICGWPAPAPTGGRSTGSRCRPTAA